MGQYCPFFCCSRKKSPNNPPIPNPTSETNSYITLNGNADNKKETLNDLEKQFNDIRSKSSRFHDDIKEKEKYIPNYRELLEEFNRQIIGLKDNLNIAYLNQKHFGNLLSKEESDELLNDIENISSKIIEMESLIEKQKTEIKSLESNFEIIQEKFNETKNNSQNSPNDQNRKFSVDIQSIKRLIEQTETIIKKLNENKEFYDQKKNEIENEMHKMQDKTEIKVTKIKTTRKKTLTTLLSNKNKNYSITDIHDSFFEKASELFGIRDFTKAKEILKSLYLSNNQESGDSSSDEPKLISKKWHQTCYINDEFDTHYINYELKAVGLPAGNTSPQLLFFLISIELLK